MKLPVVHGIIDRRILVNFTADPDDVQKILPALFKPKLVQGKAIVGICLIRLKHIKPKGFPDFMGISSENGAHRIAVTWERNGVQQEGVYIPRRDTSLGLNALAGGRIFPGKHHHSKFQVKEENGRYQVEFTSKDQTSIAIDAEEAECLPETSKFRSLDEASDFFRAGAAGYSPNKRSLDGILLDAYNWSVRPLSVNHVASSFFQDNAVFRSGSVQFDNALLMRNVEHEWRALPDL
ncbi:MAG: hypothetical protein EOO45_17015 [Flavobacterium sp.]|nr:MAG: hypothetical protein EOO45_17015 [Flavobacterium sp.]